MRNSNRPFIPANDIREINSQLQVLASILNIQVRSTNDFTLLSDAATNTSASSKGPARTDLLPPASLYRGLIAGGQLYTPYHGRRINCTQRLRSRISPACSTSSPPVSPAHQCACPTTFASKYRYVLGGSRTTSSDK